MLCNLVLQRSGVCIRTKQLTPTLEYLQLTETLGAIQRENNWLRERTVGGSKIEGLLREVCRVVVQWRPTKRGEVLYRIEMYSRNGPDKERQQPSATGTKELWFTMRRAHSTLTQELFS
jgi:hypothetical protein